MCFDITEDRTPAQRAYVRAVTHLLIARDELQAREADERSAIDGLSDEEANDPVLIGELDEEAIGRSGLSDDNPVVIEERAALQTALKIAEAVNNGLDAEDAFLIGLSGGDPRQLGGLV